MFTPSVVLRLQHVMPAVREYSISPNLRNAYFTFDADTLEAWSECSGVFHIDSRIKTEHVFFLENNMVSCYFTYILFTFFGEYLV